MMDDIPRNEDSLELLYCVLDAMCEAPDSQIDASIVEKLKKLREQTPENIVVDLKNIIDECVYASLASDFSIAMMSTALELTNKHITKH